jgi:hypothetical protein
MSDEKKPEETNVVSIDSARSPVEARLTNLLLKYREGNLKCLFFAGVVVNEEGEWSIWHGDGGDVEGYDIALALAGALDYEKQQALEVAEMLRTP